MPSSEPYSIGANSSVKASIDDVNMSQVELPGRSPTLGSLSVDFGKLQPILSSGTYVRLAFFASHRKMRCWTAAALQEATLADRQRPIRLELGRSEVAS